MSNTFVSFGFKGYPSKDDTGKVGHFDGTAKIKLRPNKSFQERWTVDGFRAQRQGNCAALPETAWNVLDLERWLRGKCLSEINALVTAAEEAEGK